jgi:hypothetical protein
MEKVDFNLIGGCDICSSEAYFNPGVPPKKVYRFTRKEKYPKKKRAAAQTKR